MRVILVDAMHLMYRCAYAYADLKTTDGLRSGIVHGFLTNIIMLAENYKDSALVFCWDHGDSWRKLKAPNVYKSNRGHWDVRSVVLTDVDVLQNHFLAHIGYKQISYPSIEGDDCISLLVNQFSFPHPFNTIEILIYSGDRDFNQLVNDRVKIIRNSKEGMVMVDEATVHTEYGIRPCDWVKMRALCGDSSDGLPGVKGVGEKTAVALLSMGVDPSVSPKPTLKDHRLSPRLIEDWHKVRLNYRLSMLPKESSEIDVTSSDQQSLSALVNKIVRDPRRKRTNNIDALRAKMIEYELAYVYSRRHLFFSFL